VKIFRCPATVMGSSSARREAGHCSGKMEREGALARTSLSQETLG